TGGQILVPTSHAAEFGVGTAPEQRRKHHPTDLTQQFLLAPQTPFDLGHQAFRQPQGIEGLLEGFGGLLCLAAITGEALLCCAAATRSGFRELFGVSCGGGHEELLCPVWLWCGRFGGKRAPYGGEQEIGRASCGER